MAAADQVNQKNNDKTESNSESPGGLANLQKDSKSAVTFTSTDKQQETQSEVQKGSLPSLEIANGSRSRPADSSSGLLSSLEKDVAGVTNVAKDLAIGAVDELIHHPLQVAADVAIGAGLGAVAIASAPWVGTAMLVGGAALVGYEIYENGSDWMNATKEVFDPNGYSKQQLAQADATLQGLGGDLTQLAAGTVGGIYGGPLLAPYVSSAYGAIGSLFAGSADAGAATAAGTTPGAEAGTDSGTPPATDSSKPVTDSSKPSTGTDQTPKTEILPNTIVVDGIPVSGPQGMDLNTATNSKIFSDWMNNLDPNIKVNSVEVQSMDLFGSKVGFLKIKADAVDLTTGKPLPGIAFLRGGSVGILPVLVGPDGTEYAAVVNQARVPIGSESFEEIPAGMQMGATVKGVAVDEMAQETGMKPTEKNLIPLGDIYPSPGGSDEKITLYALRENVTQEQLDQINGRTGGLAEENEHTRVKIVPLDKLSQSQDGKAVAAWARYRALPEATKTAGTSTFDTGQATSTT